MRANFAGLSARPFAKLGIAMLLGGTSLASNPALAQQTAPVAENPEIVVTAQKREESLQKVPISIQALGAKKLAEHQVTSFDDYAKLLPSVSFQSYGPGQSQIYFRGVSTGSDANGSFGGSQPTSALYLDELPLTTIGGAADLHVYDIQRVEALSGPQGTLFGSSSLSGTLRLITNKPSHKLEAGFDVSGTTFGKGSNSSGGSETFLRGEGRSAVSKVAMRFTPLLSPMFQTYWDAPSALRLAGATIAPLSRKASAASTSLIEAVSNT